jgi:hypothetical protein
VLVTEWRQYQNPDFTRLARVMRGHLLVDGRNVWSSYGLAESGFNYEGIGVRSEVPRDLGERDTLTPYEDEEPIAAE